MRSNPGNSPDTQTDLVKQLLGVAGHCHMVCRTCLELLDAYKRSVSLFTTAERNMRGLIGDDFQLAFKQLESLHQTCMEANAAVTEHWQQEHSSLAEQGNLAKKATAS